MNAIEVGGLGRQVVQKHTNVVEAYPLTCIGNILSKLFALYT